MGNDGSSWRHQRGLFHQSISAIMVCLCVCDHNRQAEINELLEKLVHDIAIHQNKIKHLTGAFVND